MKKNDIISNWSNVKTQIASAGKKSNRADNAVMLLAVSKTFPAQDIERLSMQGQMAFAENYVQEGVEKVLSLAHLPLEWHFIGPIQSNKTRLIAAHFDWVHTVSSVAIAKRLSDQRPLGRAALNICIQVNISGESSKHGVLPQDIRALADAIRLLPNLRLRGLMSIPAPTDDYALQLASHCHLKTLFDTLNQEGFELDTLSMGMSNDMCAAIEAGSTMVRIGSAIFGERA